VVICIPNFIRARSTPATNACANNLRQFDGAKQQWALNNRQTKDDTPTWDDLCPYLGGYPDRGMPTCPQGGVYTLGRVGEPPRCSIGPPHHSIE